MVMDSLSHRLIFIRHGETNWNAQGRLQGQHDTPLNGRGRDQAANAGREARKYIAREGLTGLRYVASPLSRTRDTMDQAPASALSAAPHECARKPAIVRSNESQTRWHFLISSACPSTPASAAT